MVAFRRPDFTRQVLAQVRKVKPKKLYVIMDGPREGNPEDLERIEEVKAVFNHIDWDCEVFKNFSDRNLGCSKRPYTGFSWVLEHEESAIFLEDDCVPSVSFFRYCDEILEKYWDDKRIMLVSGTNWRKTWQRGDYSYHFSRLGGIHGWATWRRAWNQFDIEIQKWDDQAVKDLLKNKFDKNFILPRSLIYDRLVHHSGETTAWDYQWGFARMINSGLAVVPCKNLIKNIGYGEDSTHTKNANSPSADLPLMEMDFPLSHPPFVIEDVEYDRAYIDYVQPFHLKQKLVYLRDRYFRK